MIIIGTKYIHRKERIMESITPLLKGGVVQK